MLIIHAKEILDRGLGNILALWHLDDDTSSSGAVENIQIRSDGKAFVIAVAGYGEIIAPFAASGLVRSSDVMIPHEQDPSAASELFLRSPEGDPVDILEDAGIDVPALNLAAVQQAEANSRSPSSQGTSYGKP